jgi:hypothetical protein
VERTAAASLHTVPVTTIVVNSGTDPDVSDSKTCISDSPCTLRRAVVQARGLSGAQKPVLISFNIPATAGEGYISAQQIWRIQFSGISSAANAALRYLTGGVIIDGTTQPGGRASGPEIILVGSNATGQDDGIKLGEIGTQNANEIIGVGFQNFKTHIYVNSGSNIITNNWFGLSNDGTNIVLRGGIAGNGSGSACPNCIIELFLEDTDGINEALQSLAVVSANASGNWTATIPAPLTNSQGLRTTSTTAANNTISGMSLGTTTGLSTLYRSGHQVFVAFVRR